MQSSSTRIQKTSLKSWKHFDDIRSSTMFSNEEMSFKRLMRDRPRTILSVIQEFIMPMIATDVDTVWKKDPRPHISPVGYSVWVPNDQSHSEHARVACAGLIVIIPEEASLRLLRWNDTMYSRRPMRNQYPLNHLLGTIHFEKTINALYPW